jgi:hypothetical protein
MFQVKLQASRYATAGKVNNATRKSVINIGKSPKLELISNLS